MSFFYNVESTWLSLKHHAFRSLLAMLGVVLGTVRRRIARAHSILRRNLGGEA